MAGRPLSEDDTEVRVARSHARNARLERRPQDAGAGGQWCRVYLDEISSVQQDQTIAPSNREIVEFNSYNNPWPDYFEVGYPQAGTDPPWAIKILQTGMYAASYRLALDSIPDAPFATELNGVDWNEYLYYERTHDPATLSGYGVHDSYVFRSGPTYGAEPPLLYIIANNDAAATTNLVIDTGGANGTYFELLRLGPTSPVGNPWNGVSG